MVRTAKITVSLPQELIAIADRISREKKISRSKVVSSCLQDFADRQKISEMVEGYKAMAKENRQLALMASKVEHEVLPEWK